ncbi:MAG TPA: efflux RND transporter periplasmic adaptor subunit, partial [Gemmataceae bacterium]|nr:efflux RND transporter periplasmic adaptor subunit [Gemmataceae bacterium]
LARIDPRLSQAAYDREKAALATQKAELARLEALVKQAKRNEDRAVNLRKTNIDYVSDQEMDQLHFNRLALEAQVDVAKANIDVATAGLENAKTNLDFTKIIAPVDGIVIDRKVDPGQTVAAGFQTPEMFILAPDMEKHMYVYASVDEADIGQIRASQEKERRVTFTVDAYPEDVFTGKIFQVRKSSTTTQNVVTYPVVIEAPNPGMKLMPGMTANISFQIDVRENVTRIPLAAIRFVPPPQLLARPDDKQYTEVKTKKDPKEVEEKLSAERRAEQARAKNKRVVWVQEGDKVVAIPITIGLMDGQFAELVSGDVKVGQTLVTGLEGANDRENR